MGGDDGVLLSEKNMAQYLFGEVEAGKYDLGGVCSALQARRLKRGPLRDKLDQYTPKQRKGIWLEFKGLVEQSEEGVEAGRPYGCEHLLYIK